VLTEATQFLIDLDRLEIALKAVIFNRTHEPSSMEPLSMPVVEEKVEAALTKQLSRALHPPLTNSIHREWLVKNFFAHQALADGEASRFTQFAKKLPTTTPFVRVPVLPAFPGDFSGLISLCGYLFPAARKIQSSRKGRKKE